MDAKKAKDEVRAPEAPASQAFGTSPGQVLSGPLATRDEAVLTTRVRVNKAYKMFVGGAFVRSESGRYFQVQADKKSPAASADPDLVNMPRASRKDLRDAVLIAKNAFEPWAARTAFNRGQILYRLAEVVESRSPELEAALVRGGASLDDARAEVAATVDRCVYYAGFADKISALLASHNPVSGPHFGFSIPEPMGVVGVMAPQAPALLGLVSTILPVIVSGNTVIALASEKDPRTAIVFAECLATSDLPGGVVNILTGGASELGSHFAKHREVAAIDAWTELGELRAEVERLSADSVKRVKTHGAIDARAWYTSGQGLTWIERFVETKTIWHPVGV